MTPKIVVILDRGTLKTDIFRYDEGGPLPPLVNPPRPQEVKDGPGRPAEVTPPPKGEDPKPS